MKPLIIYAHPGKGHCSKILEEVKSRIDCDVIDLYELGYDPVLKWDELYSSGNKEVSEQNLKFQEMVSNASKLIFIHPMWWGNMPAILKGFMDRVFVADYAFKYVKGRPFGLLKARAVVFVTSGGPGFLYKVMRGPLKTLTYILGFCGIKSKVFLYDRARGDVDSVKVKKLVKKGLGWLGNGKS